MVKLKSSSPSVTCISCTMAVNSSPPDALILLLSASPCSTATAVAAKTRTNTAAINANDKANIANNAAINANSAAQNANSARDEAYSAAQNANASANKADMAASNANTAASNANTARDSANTAAAKADAAAHDAQLVASDCESATYNATVAANSANAAAMRANNAAASVEDMTVTSENVGPDALAEAVISEINGHKNIHFRLKQGKTGAAYIIKGDAYETVADLEAAITSPEIGDQYNVGLAAPYHVYRWTGTKWEDQGSIGISVIPITAEEIDAICV